MYPKKPEVELIGIEKMSSEIERGANVEAAKAAGRNAVNSALAAWQAECDTIKAEVQLQAEALRNRADSLRQDALILTSQANVLSADADQIERELEHG